MKSFQTTVLLILTAFTLNAQEEMDLTLVHDDIVRTYSLYIPASYSEDESAPLIFNFHGYGSNAFEQTWYGDFRAIADTAGFLLVHPQGTELDGVSHWNVGGWTVGSTVDDVGFTEAMIDTLSLDYNIDPDRIYSTGMSNGGYMSFLLACQLSDRIAAVASVTGSMTPETFDNCSPSHPTPIMQIHGTADGTVPYDGDIWTESIDDVLNYWTSFNNCSDIPVITPVPDINTTDGCTAEQHVYLYGDNGTSVEHYKVIDGQHTWPGTFFTSAGTNQDFNASIEIWRFFSQYDLNGSIAPVSITKQDEALSLGAFPNPADQAVRIEHLPLQPVQATLRSPSGKTVWEGVLSEDRSELDVSQVQSGLYYLTIGEQSIKILVQH